LESDPRFQRGNELWRLGLYNEARLEFEDLREAESEDPANSYRLANHLIEIGLYRSGILAARQVLTLADMDDAETLSAPIYFNHIRFGTYFRDLVIQACQTYDFHPLFLFSLIRQESLFEGFVRSSADARGLMQIIPSTGQEVASNAGWPPDYTSEDLYRPLVSINLGADYLDRQRAFLDGDIYAALAAYNGGPGNALTWQRLVPPDPDLYLEVIRFEETRLYIRRIYEIFNIYRQIYNRTP
jgi:soluble lytic murein transglycosylase